MKSLSFILFLFLTITIFSCGKSEQEIKNEEEKTKQEQKDSLQVKFDKENEEAITTLNKKYDAVIGWDTLEEYSYYYQERFLDQKQLLSFTGEITDVIKSDSSYVLRLTNNSARIFFAEVFVSSEMFNKLKKNLNPNDRTDDQTFILKINAVKPIELQLASEDDVNGADEDDRVSIYDIDTYINAYPEHLILFKGELIDFYFNKKSE